MSFHIPAHKAVGRCRPGQISNAHSIALTRAERQIARIDAIPVTEEEDAAFNAMNGTTYQAALFPAWCDAVQATPYNHRDCNAIIEAYDNFDTQWPIFAQLYGYCLDAIEWLPAGSTRQSMFLDNGIRITDDRIFERD
jgi:hypothetical protein